MAVERKVAARPLDAAERKYRRARLLVWLAALVLVSLLARRFDARRPAPAAPARRTAAVAPADPAPAPSANVPAGALPPAPAPFRAAIEGRVVSAADGRGIAGAQVDFLLGGAAGSATSDSTGAFRFEPFAPGVWRIASVRAPGYLPFEPPLERSPFQLRASEGSIVNAGDFPLEPAVPIEVAVRDSQGRPVAGAALSLLGSPEAAATVEPRPAGWWTGPDGIALAVVPDGAVLVAQARQGSGAERMDVEARARGWLEIGLRENAAVPVIAAGVVVGPSGRPVAGATVLSGSPTHFVYQRTVADDLGRFELGALHGEDAGVVARAPGLAGAWTSIPAEGARDLVLRLSAPGRLAGRVRDRVSGAAIPRYAAVVVVMADAFDARDVRLAAVADPDGSFEVDDLPAGRAHVMILRGACRFSSLGEAEVEIAGGPEPARVEIEVDRPQSLQGRVVDARTGRAVPGARVQDLDDVRKFVPRPELVGLSTRAFADDEGRFRLEVCSQPPALMVEAPGYQSRKVESTAVGDALGHAFQVELEPLDRGRGILGARSMR